MGRQKKLHYMVTLATTDRSDADLVPTVLLCDNTGKKILDTPEECEQIIEREITATFECNNHMEAYLFTTNTAHDDDTKYELSHRTYKRVLFTKLRKYHPYCVQLRTLGGDREDIYTIHPV